MIKKITGINFDIKNVEHFFYKAYNKRKICKKNLKNILKKANTLIKLFNIISEALALF